MAVDTATPDTGSEIRSYHVHLARPPYCKSWSNETAEDRARTFASESDAVVGVEGPYGYTSTRCPWKQEQEAFDKDPVEALPEAEEAETSEEIADAVIEAVPGLAEAEEVVVVVPPPEPLSAAPAASEPEPAPTAVGTPPLPILPAYLRDLACEECGEPIGEHSHPRRGGTSARATGPRTKPEDRPPCPHCGGPIHWNDSGGKVNFECLLRQQLVAEHRITNPQTERLPVATAADIVALGTWISNAQAAGAPLQYGKMAAAGGASTYSGIRSMSRPPKEPKPTPITAAIHEAMAEVNAAIPEPAAVQEPEAPKKLTKEQKRAERQKKLKQMKKK